MVYIDQIRVHVTTKSQSMNPELFCGNWFANPIKPPLVDKPYSRRIAIQPGHYPE